MRDGFVRQKNDRLLSVEKIVTVFYKEYGKDFVFAGESHDFWEFTYIDKGSVKFTADTREFLLKGGEIAFHKPNEFHKLAADKGPPNVTVASFVCNSDAMKLLKTKFLSDFARTRAFVRIPKRRSCGVRAADISAAYYGNARKANAPFAAKQLTFNLLGTFFNHPSAPQRTGDTKGKPQRE